MKRASCNIIVRGLLWLVPVLVGLSLLPGLETYLRGNYTPYEYTKTNNQLTTYKGALIRYHKHYGDYPVSCTNVAELLSVFFGASLRECNQENIVFISDRKLAPTDGWGRDFVLIRSFDGTNLIIRSKGKRPNFTFDDLELNTKKMYLQQESGELK